MALTVVRHGTGIETRHTMRNGTLQLTIMSGLDARISSLVHQPTERELLKQDRPLPYASSAYPYGISVWVKTGDTRDVYSGALVRTLLPYDYLLSKRPRITQNEHEAVYTAVHLAEGVRLEKRYALPATGSRVGVTVRITNVSSAPLRLQLEQPLAWHTGYARADQKFVLPSLSGLECIRVPQYDVTEIESLVLAEPWVAILDDQLGAEMLITLNGFERASRLFYGTHGLLCLYSPDTMLAPMGTIETSQILHYLPKLTPEAVPEDIASLHASAQAAPSRFMHHHPVTALHRWDTLVPQPQQAIRGPGSCPVSLTAVNAPASLVGEARLLQQQGARAFSTLTDGMPIHLVEAPDDYTPEAYTLEITPSGVTITGRPHGVWHGCQTLLDLLTCDDAGRVQAPCGTITDAPDLALRGMLMFPDGPDWDVRLEAFALHVLARLKINTFSFPITSHLVHYEASSLNPTDADHTAISLARLEHVVSQLRRMHIEVLPICGITPSRMLTDDATAHNDAFLERIIATCRPQRLNLRFQCLDRALKPSAPTSTPDWAQNFDTTPDDEEITIHPDDPEQVAFLKLLRRYFHFLRERGVQLVICSDLFHDIHVHACPALLEHSAWLLAHLPRDIIVQEVTGGPYAPLRDSLDASLPWTIGSPMPMPSVIRHHGQVMAQEGGLGVLTWGGELSPSSCGAVEGIIWTAAYGWRAHGPKIPEMRIRMRDRIEWITSHRWE